MQTEPTFSSKLMSERLDLILYREDDVDALFQLIASNRERLRCCFPDITSFLNTVNDAVIFIRTAAQKYETRKTYHYGIWSRENHALVGQIKVKNIIWDVPSAELSYFIGAQYLEMGYATEAVMTVLIEAFERLAFNRVFARVIPSNYESVRLCHKLGLRPEGLHKNEYRCGLGELHDIQYFSVTSAEYLLTKETWTTSRMLSHV